MKDNLLERIIKTCSNIGCNCIPWKIYKGNAIQLPPKDQLVITEWLESKYRKPSDIIFVSNGLKIDDWSPLLSNLHRHGRIYVVLSNSSLRNSFLNNLKLKHIGLIDERIIDNEYHFVFIAPRIFDKPMWKGEKGAKVLIHSSGGFGDDFHAGRYAAHLNPICDPILEARPETFKFMNECSDYEKVIFKGEKVEYDFHISIMELVDKYGKDPISFPYFSTPTQDLTLPTGLKIGFTYRGHFVKYGNCRVFDLNDFKIFNGWQLYCLHKNLDYESFVEDSICLNNWHDTACYVSLMDYVISPDTALFHLSAGMGKTTMVFAKNKHSNFYLNAGESCSESYPAVLRAYWGKFALSSIRQSIMKDRILL